MPLQNRKFPSDRQRIPGQIYLRVKELIDLATFLTENLCPLLLVGHGLKKPLTDVSGSWLTVGDAELVTTTIESQSHPPNLAVLLHPKQNSNRIFVDVDVASPPALLQDLGVTGDQSPGAGE